MSSATIRESFLFTRSTGALIIPLWLLAMSWLVARDVWPRWAAAEPPRLSIDSWLREAGNRSQFTLRNELGPIGTIWTQYLVDEKSLRREDLVWIDHLPLDITPIRVDVFSVYTEEGVLDEFTLRVESFLTPTPIKLHGERFHSDFSFTLENGPMVRAFKMPLTESGLVTGAFSPFARLKNLQVGQSWRMQVFNPIAALLNLGDRFMSLHVQVTGEERLKTGSWSGNCLIVEAGQVKAWVDGNGEVQQQEISLPMLGKLRVIRELDFDVTGRGTARRFQFIKSADENEP
ncbi:MAG: hypothetical protein AABZ47_06515 [Planctomycetota bacterium]